MREETKLRMPRQVKLKLMQLVEKEKWDSLNQLLVTISEDYLAHGELKDIRTLVFSQQAQLEQLTKDYHLFETSFSDFLKKEKQKERQLKELIEATTAQHVVLEQLLELFLYQVSLLEKRD